ncbi:unnamed protein product [Closterium sp. NIES-53]
MAARYCALAHRASRGVSRLHNKVVGGTVPSADPRTALYSFPRNPRESLQLLPPVCHVLPFRFRFRQFSISDVSSAPGTLPPPASPTAPLSPSLSPSPSLLPTHGEGMVLERAAVSTAEYTAHYMMDGGVEEVLESRYIHVGATATSAAAASYWPGTGQHTSTRHVAGRRDGQPSASFNSGGRSEIRDTDVKDDGSTGRGEGRMAEVLEGRGESGEGGEALGGKSHAPEVESAPSLQSQRSMAEHIGAVRGDMQGMSARGGKAEAEEGEKREGAGRDGNREEPGGNGGRGEGAVWVDDLDGKGYVSLGRPTNVEVGSTEGLLGNLAHVAPLDRLDSARLAEPEPEPEPAAETVHETGTATAADTDKSASCPHAATGLVGAGGGEGSEEHIHTREHEAWFLLDGQMTWTIEKETYQASKGSFMHMPLGRAHSFRNNSDQPARMLVVCMPGGLEKYFLEIGDPEEAAIIGQDGAVHKPVVDQAKVQNAIKKAMLYGLVYPKGAAA